MLGTVATSSTFQRARSSENKTQRRESILAAAAQLATRDGVRQVTLTDIAARVGMHKSALLRYFETREQIFLELTGRSWRDWAAAVRAGLADVACDNELGHALLDLEPRLTRAAEITIAGLQALPERQQLVGDRTRDLD